MTIPGNIGLFEGIKPEEIERLMSCMNYRLLHAKKGSYAIREGDALSSIGIVLSGSVRVVRTAGDGSRVVLASFGPSSVFAESLVCAGIPESPVSVIAEEASDLLFMPYKRIISPCAESCSFHTRLIANLMRMIAGKNLLLNGKLDIMSKRTTREKVLAYLESERAKAGTDEFEIPYDRHELADYLSVDRSALSRELSRMGAEGLVAFEGNRFRL
jgi:CRP/FNR family transcriptional regulator, dissimilatory nitrate respiration regulator